MAHWLEEAEGEQRKGKQRSQSARIQDKKYRISQNYEKNKEKYDWFIQRMYEMVDRVHSLPLEQREPFGSISTKKKESKLENHLHVFSSTRRYQKHHFSGLRSLLKKGRFKHIRTLYLYVSRYEGNLRIELQEKKVLKQLIRDEVILGKARNTYTDPDKFRKKFLWEMEKLDDEFCLTLIDYLAFKIEKEKLPFVD